MTLFDFMDRHWFASIILALVIAGVIQTPFQVAFKAYNRKLRSKNIAECGWPPPHLDADGDAIKTTAEEK